LRNTKILHFWNLLQKCGKKWKKVEDIIFNHSDYFLRTAGFVVQENSKGLVATCHSFDLF
jgi:hypothetical protein